ncbi:MAG: BolA family protein [Thiohalospira sp.]
MSRKQRIEQRLTEELAPEYLAVEDESHMHNVPEGAESHFRVTLVTPAFEGESRVGRHRAVNRALAAEFDQGLHALALHTHAPSEWTGEADPASPPCLGGGKA